MAKPQIYKRGDFWAYRIQYTENGKRKSLSGSGFTRKSLAEKAATDALYHKSVGMQIDKADILVPDYFISWINLYKKDTYTNNTMTGAKSVHKHLTKRYNIKLKDVSKDNYQSFLNSLTADGYSPYSVRTFHRYVKMVLSDAHYQKIIAIDPTERIVLPKVIKSKKDKTLTLAEYKALMTAIKASKMKDVDVLIMFLLVSGCRMGEGMGLTWDCVDFKRNMVTINKSCDFTNHFNMKATKNAASNRTIGIVSDMMQLLKSKEKINDRVFGNHYPGTIIDHLAKHMAAAGIDKRLTAHDLRHAHASLLLAQGVQVLTVSKRLGHTDPTTTMNIYAHILEDNAAKENDKINSIVSFE